MFRKIRRFFLLSLLFSILFLIAILGYVYFLLNYSQNNTFYSTTNIENSQSNFDSIVNPRSLTIFETDTFSLTQFQLPANKYKPWLKWWWYGTEINSEKVFQNLALFKSQGYGGVEIQSTINSIYPFGKEERRNRVFGSQNYLKTLEQTLEKAEELGLQVDIQLPLGGNHISLENSLKTIAYTEKTTSGNKQLSWEIPLPKMSFLHYFFNSLENYLGFHTSIWKTLDGTEIQLMDFTPDKAELLRVLAYKEKKGGNERRRNPLALTGYIQLEAREMVDLTGEVNQNTLKWNVPEGEWRILAIYQMPTGENPQDIPSRTAGFYVDFFNKDLVQNHLNVLLSDEIDWQKYQGKPLRFFSFDNFQINADRLITDDFLNTFQRKRKHDLSTHLPAMIYPGYDSFWLNNYLQSKRNPSFRIRAEDDRIRYEYNQVLSDLLISNFIQGTSQWANPKGFAVKTQAFGIHMDIIQAAGIAQIPETEQYYGGGSNLFLKMVSSGANLYERPIISAEALNFGNRAYMSSPQKMKLAVDKLFSAGINQVVLQGYPYQQEAQNYGKEGWLPFASTKNWAMKAENLSESNPFFDYFPVLNQYIARCQYLLRLGKPEADVLIAYPFLGFPHQPFQNTEELLYEGVWAETENLQAISSPLEVFLKQIFVEREKNNPISEWLQETTVLIQTLEQNGYTWDWVNFESLNKMSSDSLGFIHIRGKTYKALILPNLPFIPLELAKRIENLNLMKREHPMPLFIYGRMPDKQVGYLHHQSGDKKVKEYFSTILKSSFTKKSSNPETLLQELKKQNKTASIIFSRPSEELKYTRRRLPKGDQIIFFQNTYSEAVTFKIALSKEENYKYYHWLDALTGKVYQAQVDTTQNFIELSLEGYQTLFLLCQKENRYLPDSLNYPKLQFQVQKSDSIALGKWDLTVLGGLFSEKTINLSQTSLFDWRSNNSLKYRSAIGVYNSEFTLDTLKANTKYYLNLGDVYFTAQVKINGQEMPPLLWKPYQMDISAYLKQGKNRVQIEVQNPLFNGMVNRGNRLTWMNWFTFNFTAEDRNYRFYQNKDKWLLPSGLLGPVYIFLREEEIVKKQEPKKK